MQNCSIATIQYSSSFLVHGVLRYISQMQRNLLFCFHPGQIKVEVCSLGLLCNPNSPLLEGFVREFLSPASNLALADEGAIGGLLIIGGGHVDGLVVSEVVNVQVRLQLIGLIHCERASQELAHLRNNLGHAMLHVLKPQELEVWVVALTVSRLK